MLIIVKKRRPAYLGHYLRQLLRRCSTNRRSATYLTSNKYPRLDGSCQSLEEIAKTVANHHWLGMVHKEEGEVHGCGSVHMYSILLRGVRYVGTDSKPAFRLQNECAEPPRLLSICLHTRPKQRRETRECVTGESYVMSCATGQKEYQESKPFE